MSTAENQSNRVNKVLVFWLAMLFLFSGCTVFWMAGLPSSVALWLRGSAGEADIVGVGGSSGEITYDHGAWRDQSWIEEFTLTERSGRPFHSRDMEGQVWVASFFFATCPTICRTQNEQIKRLQRELGPRGVTFVSITCDPQRDTPNVLRQYADGFQADPKDWLFLTGELLHIRRVGAEFFQVSVDKETHSSRFIVVDKWGAVRGRLDWKDPQQLDELRQTIDRLLDETEPPVEQNDSAAAAGAQPGEEDL